MLTIAKPIKVWLSSHYLGLVQQHRES